MTHIEQMIKDMCPNGVEFKTLGEVCGVQRGKRLTKSELSDTEKYPVYHGGIEPLGFYKEYNREAETVMVINVGASAGTIGYSKEPFWSSDGCFCIGHSDTVIARFLYYYLQTREKEIKSRVRYAGIPTLDGFVVEQFPIPLPPLEIQKKIVECLDKFSALAAELQAELQMRRKQYEYYRTQLLTPHSDCNSADNTDDAQWEWKTLGEVCTILRGKRLTKSELSDDEKYPVFHGGIEPLGYYKEANREADTVMIINVGASAGTVGYSDKKFWSSDGCYCLSKSDFVIPKYMYYLLQKRELELKSKVRYAGIPTLDSDVIKRIKIPLPSLAEQARIVSILDKFEALTTSLSDGIPAEQAAQQKRYEYYRDLLLTFPKAEG